MKKIFGFYNASRKSTQMLLIMAFSCLIANILISSCFGFAGYMHQMARDPAKAIFEGWNDFFISYGILLIISTLVSLIVWGIQRDLER